jgi:hypothetical protein
MKLWWIIIITVFPGYDPKFLTACSATERNRLLELKHEFLICKPGRSDSRFYRKMHPLIFGHLEQRLNIHSSNVGLYQCNCPTTRLIRYFRHEVHIVILSHVIVIGLNRFPCCLAPESIEFENPSPLRRHESSVFAAFWLRPIVILHQIGIIWQDCLSNVFDDVRFQINPTRIRRVGFHALHRVMHQLLNNRMNHGC